MMPSRIFGAGDAVTRCQAASTSDRDLLGAIEAREAEPAEAIPKEPLRGP